ncbi:MAG: type II secretion system protein GspJ [Myxococcota bacterium]
MTQAKAGFTLIEVVGAVILTVVILALVGTMFTENGRQRSAALEKMRERLSATGALELLAQDLESAVHLSRPEGRDPESHPWRFVAADPSEYGATAFRFTTQNAPQSNRGPNSSGWVDVAYFLAEGEQGQRTLWRWLSPRPPFEANASFPDAGDDGAMRMMTGISDFGVRFLDAEGGWVDEWDSTFYPPEAALPEAAEISISLMRKARPGEADVDTTHVPGLIHSRRVALMMRPIDVAALIELAADANAEEDGCFTIEACLREGDTEWYQSELNEDCDGDDRLCDLLANPGDSCFSEIESSYPDVASRAPEGCSS